METNIVTRGADGSVDICTSFTDSCSFWLQALLCDAEEVNDNNCVGSGQDTDEVEIFYNKKKSEVQNLATNRFKKVDKHVAHVEIQYGQLLYTSLMI